MDKSSNEAPLIFEFSHGGRVVIHSNCSEWYLQDQSRHYGDETRQYLDNDWFHKVLSNDPKSIFKFASLFDYECNFESGRKEIEEYKKSYEKETDGYGFDTSIAVMEEFVQSATKNKNVHWW